MSTSETPPAALYSSSNTNSGGGGGGAPQSSSADGVPFQSPLGGGGGYSRGGGAFRGRRGGGVLMEMAMRGGGASGEEASWQRASFTSGGGGYGGSGFRGRGGGSGPPPAPTVTRTSNGGTIIFHSSVLKARGEATNSEAEVLQQLVRSGVIKSAPSNLGRQLSRMRTYATAVTNDKAALVAAQSEQHSADCAEVASMYEVDGMFDVFGDDDEEVADVEVHLGVEGGIPLHDDASNITHSDTNAMQGGSGDSHGEGDSGNRPKRQRSPTNTESDGGEALPQGTSHHLAETETSVPPVVDVVQSSRGESAEEPSTSVTLITGKGKQKRNLLSRFS